jgi:uncharacterized protein YjbI with pentapeptide repeats
MLTNSKVLTSLLLLVPVVLAPPIQAQTAALIRQLQQTKKCEQCNLSGAILYGSNLEGASLIQANLSGADLRRTNLNGADLSGANLSGANLTDANLMDVDLTDANLRDANMNKKVLSIVLLCNTTLPEGRVSKRDCSRFR